MIFLSLWVFNFQKAKFFRKTSQISNLFRDDYHRINRNIYPCLLEELQLSNKYAKNMGKNEEKHKYFSANFDTARKSEFGHLIRHCSLYRIEKKGLFFQGYLKWFFSYKNLVSVFAKKI